MGSTPVEVCVGSSVGSWGVGLVTKKAGAEACEQLNVLGNKPTHYRMLVNFLQKIAVTLTLYLKF